MMSTAAQPGAILVVDDDPMMRDLLTQLLHATLSGVDIVAVADAEQAVKQLAERMFPLVITDYRMPGMTGLELAELVKAGCPDTCIVLMSAERVNEVGREHQAQPVDYHLTKPFPLANLTSIVVAVLEALRRR